MTGRSSPLPSRTPRQSGPPSSSPSSIGSRATWTCYGHWSRAGLILSFVTCHTCHPAPWDASCLTQMASVAELEAGLISERTKAALAAAKARGVKLGNPNGARALRGKQTGNSEAVAAIKRKAQEHAANLRSIVDDIRDQGITSIRKITDELNERDVPAPRGGEWQPTMVVRLLDRLKETAPSGSVEPR